MWARSLLQAFDVAKHGAVALERTSCGRWQAAFFDRERLDDGLFSPELSEIAIL